MIGCRVVNGSLGNAMFFIATAIAHALKNNTTFGIEENVKGLAPLFRYPFAELAYSWEKLRELPVYRDPVFSFSSIPDAKHLMLEYGPGYYQSYKYFDEIKNDLKNLYFTPSNEALADISGRISVGIRDYPNGDYAALHVRRGDYLKFPHHPVLPLDYYKKAISLIPEAKKILVFSNDRYWCKQNLNFDPRFVHVYPSWGVKEHDGRVDDEWDWRNGVDMMMMRYCKYHIIANSTYSWWGAYLSDSEQVIYPSGWFDGPLLRHDTSDLCPPEWIKL